MQFALLGNYPDGLHMAQALVETSRHELTAYSGPTVPWENLGLIPKRVIGDIEEILADPTIEAVIVAGALAERPAHLRRALQSERHVLCAYPPDDTPDITYEAAMIQSDTGRVLLPLLPWAVHPVILRLRELLRQSQPQPTKLRLIEWHRNGMEKPESDIEIGSGCFPGWEVLQALGGPIAEVSAFAEQTVREANEPLLVAGRFEKGGVFQAILTPYAPEKSWRIRLTASTFQAELSLGACGKSELTWTDDSGASHREEFQGVNAFLDLVRIFENAVRKHEHPDISKETLANEPTVAEEISWRDAVRCAELDDAARRSVERRRATTLDYPEATEEAGFKGTMTLIGCGMLWVMLVLLVLARWYPVLLVVIVIMLTVFLCLQVLRAIVRKNG